MKLLNLGCGGHFHPDWTNVDFRCTGPGVLACDLAAGVPFPDASFDAAYSSHLLEHFPRSQAPAFLAECFRVLRPGGVVRIVVPDLEGIVRLYLANLEGALAGDRRAEARYDWLLLELFDQMVRDRPGGDMLDYWMRDPLPAEDFVVERLGGEVAGFLERFRSGKWRPERRTYQDEAERRAAEAEFRRSGEPHRWMYDRLSLARLLRAAGFDRPTACAADQSAIPDFGRYGLDVLPDGRTRKPDSLFMEAVRPG